LLHIRLDCFGQQWGYLYLALYGEVADVEAVLMSLKSISGLEYAAAFAEILRRRDLPQQIRTALELHLVSKCSLLGVTSHGLAEAAGNAIWDLTSESSDREKLDAFRSLVRRFSRRQAQPFIIAAKTASERMKRLRGAKVGVARNLYPQQEGPQEDWLHEVYVALAGNVVNETSRRKTGHEPYE
jgi:hypothetical protein